MLKLNVGFSKKLGEPNYGSRGAAVNLELELDPEYLGDAERLKERIRQLFQQAKASVHEELGVAREPHPGDANGAAKMNGRPRDRTRPATAAQIRALGAIADRWQFDLGEWLFERFGSGDPAELSITEASGLIDELRGVGPRSRC